MRRANAVAALFLAAGVLVGCTSSSTPTLTASATTAAATATSAASARTPTAAGAAATSATSTATGTPSATAAAGAPTAAAATAAAGRVGVTLKEFSVVAAPASTRAGAVTFDVSNTGALPHEFVVVQSDLPPASLPQKDQKAVDETVVKVVARLAEFDGGKRGTLAANLTPGKYILLCDVPSHYETGMFIGFTVQ